MDIHPELVWYNTAPFQSIPNWVNDLKLTQLDVECVHDAMNWGPVPLDVSA